MRIERHAVAAERLREAAEHFAERIHRAVDLQEQAGRDPDGWRLIGDDLLDYAGARSAENPEIDHDAFTALHSAAEARLFALELATAPPDEPLAVVLPYTGTGVSYRGTSERERRADPVHGPDWLEALYLWIVTSDPRRRQSAFDRAAGDAPSPYVQALYDLVFRDGGRTADLMATPRSDEERALHALATGDQDAFWQAIAAMLTGPVDADPPPGTLLPTAPLALTALAVRRNGWAQRIESDYLPRRLTGGATRTGPAVGPVERPPFPDDVSKQLDVIDRGTPSMIETVWKPALKAERLPLALTMNARNQLQRFRLRSVLDPEGRDPRQREALELASQLTAALFAVTAATEDTVRVAIGGRTAPLKAAPMTSEVTSFTWNNAMALALITGSEERRDLLLSVHPDDLAAHMSPVHRAYHVALRTYLSAGPAGRAADTAVALVKEISDARPDFLGPPAAPLSRLVDGDREGFAAALTDALAAHRDHYGVASRRDDPDGLIDFGVLALACHARRDLGWEIPAAPGYLPAAIVAPDGG